MSDSTRAVFLSYASQDAEAAARIAGALRAAGVEVWFDKSDLRGGDAWDAKIRRQIRECALFVPIVSANTQARPEGYFRLEWKLAVDRSHLMADDQPFLLPVVIGDIPDAAARVPDRFREVQWTRLRMDETPAEFGMRVRALLAGSRAESSDNQTEPGEKIDRRDRRGRGRSGPASTLQTILRYWWLPLPFLGVAFAFSGMWASRPASAEHESAKADAPAAASAAESEARRLVARARALYERWDGATREDFKLAEDLLKQAVELAPTDAEVWGAYGVWAAGCMLLGHDASPARMELLRSASERAVKLAPGSALGQLARAYFLRTRGATQGEAEKLLRELTARFPNDGFICHALGALLRSQRRVDEALAVLDRAAALPGGGPLGHYNKFLLLSTAQRYGEAEAALDAGLAAQPAAFLYRAKMICLMEYHGDLDQAAAVLEKIPPEFLVEDSVAFAASKLWLWRREPDKALLALRALPRDYIESNEYRGPKAFLVGLANQMAGRSAAARVEWEAALQLIEQRLAVQPNSIHLLYWKARLLASLERKAEAEEALQTFEQLTGSNGLSDQTFPIYLLLGRRDELIVALEKRHPMIIATGNPILRAIAENQLRHAPEWELIRDDPRVQRLLSDDGSTSPEAK